MEFLEVLNHSNQVGKNVVLKNGNIKTGVLIDHSDLNGPEPVTWRFVPNQYLLNYEPYKDKNDPESMAIRAQYEIVIPQDDIQEVRNVEDEYDVFI